MDANPSCEIGLASKLDGSAPGNDLLLESNNFQKMDGNIIASGYNNGIVSPSIVEANLCKKCF